MGKHTAPQTSDSALAELRAALSIPDIWPGLFDAVQFLRPLLSNSKHGNLSLPRNAKAMKDHYIKKGRY